MIFYTKKTINSLKPLPSAKDSNGICMSEFNQLKRKKISYEIFKK